MKNYSKISKIRSKKMELIAGKSGDNVNLIVKDFDNELEYDFYQSELEGLAKNSIDVAITALNTLHEDTEIVEDALYKVKEYLLQKDCFCEKNTAQLVSDMLGIVNSFLEYNSEYED
jgi:hypothetical protein